MRSKIQKRFLEALLLLVACVLIPAAMLINRWLQDDLRQLEHANRALWVAALVALALSLLLGAGFSRWLSRPVLAMTAAARAMSRGDFDVHLPPPRDDELGDLVRALSTLGAQLAAHIPQLRAEGEKLRTILNGLPEGVALVQRGSITVANPAFGALIGTRQVEGRRPLEAARVPELAEAIQAALTSGHEVEREALVGGRAVHLQARPLGEPASQQVVVVLLDMTEARRLERLRRDLVANASHELRTPVAAIVAAAETLACGAAADPEARNTFINILLRHAQRLSRLTNDLLDLSRLEAGFRPRVETLPVHSAVQAVLNALEARAREKEIVLESQTRKDLAVSADRAAVEQILTNLVDNAIKYTPRGGRVRVSADAKDSRVVIGVEDTGPGIPEEHLPRLFERFYRVDEARSRELGGTGLGLAIVKHLVLAHGGEVAAQSQLGSGSRFLVWLPRA